MFINQYLCAENRFKPLIKGEIIDIVLYLLKNGYVNHQDLVSVLAHESTCKLLMVTINHIQEDIRWILKSTEGKWHISMQEHH